MFAAIETNGASHIVIHIPHDGSEKSLPALARMLEQNATFVRVGYQEMHVVKPVMTITLGDTYTIQGQDDPLTISVSGAVIGEDFVNATHAVLTSNAASMRKARDEHQRLRTELSFVKDELTRAKERLEALAKLDA